MKRRRQVLNSEWGRALARLMASSRDCQTQCALARKSGISQSSIGRILRGEVDPTVGTMTFLAVALGMTLKTTQVEVDPQGESRVQRLAVEALEALEALDRVIDQLEDAQRHLARLRKDAKP